MYVRMTFFKLRQGGMQELRDLYNKEVVSAHKSHKGIRFVHLLVVSLAQPLHLAYF